MTGTKTLIVLGGTHLGPRKRAGVAGGAADAVDNALEALEVVDTDPTALRRRDPG